MKLKNTFNLIILYLLTIAASIVCVTSIVTTIYYDMHVDVDFPHYKSENYIALFLSITLLIGLYVLLYRKKVFEKTKLMAGIMVFVCVGYCLLLIFSIRPLPVTDAKLLDDVINEFMMGDYSSLKNAGGYLYIWPFQLGYVAFGQIMTVIFGSGNYIAWDIVQLLSILITVIFLYKITWELFEDKIVCSVMALMSTGMLFFYNYVTFIYGDILSMAPQTIALYLTVLFVKNGKIRDAAWAAPFMATAILLKPNCVITMIAIMMMIIGSAFISHDSKNTANSTEISVDKHLISDDDDEVKVRSNKNSYSGKDITIRLIIRVALCIFMIFVVTSFNKTVKLHYLRVADLDNLPTGSPSVSHIVMGLSESELEDGWYNGYNYRVFGENGCNTEATRVAATKDLMERLSTFAHHPYYAARFFTRKFTTQWADPVCISTHDLDLVSRHVKNQPALADFLVFGTGSDITSWIMNVFMTFCYLGVLIYLFNTIKEKKVSDAEMLLLILIFGGMVFHEFWEGSSRYAMRYYVYFIPYAAWGIKMLIGKLGEKNEE